MPNKYFIIHVENGIHRLSGPFSIEEVLTHLGNGRLSWADFMMTAENPQCIRLYEAREFKDRLPVAPSKAVLQTFMNRIGQDGVTATAFQKNMDWILQINGSEFGPFPLSKIESMLGKTKSLGPVYVWTKGMKNWARADSFEDLNRIYNEVYESRGKKKNPDLEVELGRNKRGSSRLSLVATVALASPAGSKNRTIGVCGNLSRQGLLLLLNEDYSIQVGMKMAIEISPLSSSGLKPFQVQALVQWASEKQAGLFFVGISVEVQQTIIKYLDEFEKSPSERGKISAD